MKALLIINMQNITVGRNHAKKYKYHRIKLVDRINEKIKEYDKDNVYYIKTIMKDNFYNRHMAPFKNFEDSSSSKLVSSLDIVSDNIYSEYKMNTFKNKVLINNLKAKGIDEICLVGVDSSLIIFSAVLALKKHFRVTINMSLVDSYDEKFQNKILKKIKNIGIDIIEVGEEK